MAQEHCCDFVLWISLLNQGADDYLDGKLLPNTNEVARESIKDVDLEIPYNGLFREILSYLIPVCYETSDSRVQKRIGKLMSAIENIRYNMGKGTCSKREMNRRKNSDLTNLLTELGLSLAKQQICNLFLFRRFPA